MLHWQIILSIRRGLYMVELIASALGSLIFILVGFFGTVQYKKTNARIIARRNYGIKYLQKYPWITIVVGAFMGLCGLILLGVTISHLPGLIGR
jgi:hypothetical protein